MSSASRLGKSIVFGVVATLYVAYGLTPTAWGFYELSHSINAPFLYPVYSVLRGIDYFISLRDDALLIYLLMGLGFTLFFFFAASMIAALRHKLPPQT